MKKVFSIALALVLVGAGCTSLGGNKVVTGDWTLAFDLPNDWVMVQPYQPSDTPINLEGDINPRDSEVILQSTANHILPAGSGEIEEDRLGLFGEVVTSDYLQISVLKLDPRRIIPSESEDLGDGFFKDGEVYYFDTGEEKYKFTIKADGLDESAAVDVIMTAQVVEETIE
jgi:hypothetical protein